MNRSAIVRAGLLAALVILAAVWATRADPFRRTGVDVPAPLPPPLGVVVFTVGGGATPCGRAAPPWSGQVDDLVGDKRVDLGLGCLYVGGGLGTVFPAIGLPAGGRSVLDVTGISGLTVSLGPSNGSGPADCTWGSGPDKHCLNAHAGTDGHGACLSDSNCGGTAGACDADASCFFGPPIPVPMGNLSACIVNAIEHDVTGHVALLRNETALSTSLSARVYAAADSSPCPRCSGGTCLSGQRVGQPCSGGLADGETTIECPPDAVQFRGRLEANLSSLGTGTSIVSDPDGNFCPGQRTPGAFGGDARMIRETGAPLLSRGLFDVSLAGIFCVPATGNALLDSTADLPGPGAISITGTIALDVLPWRRARRNAARARSK